MLVGLAAVLGLVTGSFLNVVVHRVPAGRSVVRPRSACPACGAPVRARDNVPVLSWLLLRGRCRDCRKSIPVRYPLVEAGTGLVFALLVWWGGPSLLTVLHLYLAAVTICLALIDLDVHRLPDAVVLPSYGVVGAILLAHAALTGAWGELGRGLAGGAILFAAYFLTLLAYPRGMGFGDVKLAGLLGLVLGHAGWPNLVVGSFAAFLLGGLFAVGLLLARRARRGTAIPFGPWMLLGAWVGLLAGDAVWQGYLGLVGLG